MIALSPWGAQCLWAHGENSAGEGRGLEVPPSRTCHVPPVGGKELGDGGDSVEG